MLDLGGGPARIGMATVTAHPTMKGVNFDLSPMAKISKIYIKEYEIKERMEVIDDDFYPDSIGKGYDLLLTCSSVQGIS